MASKVDAKFIQARINDNADEYAVEFLPPDSFARHAYDSKPFPAIKRAKTVADADSAECAKWGLTPDEWVDEMDAARIALAHDMKLDLIKKGITPAM